ncbi:hypothetical protein CAter282_3702 [Collimonas arenae]|uniref:Uncharacterized protein n=1 Tax=Collimonas arenae TaxID=279058 RepID=A0A127QNK7_9BURK|nr:hypothetical protein [Collimonas arenae]AMP11385.1 hypothetical protein CAter282_3702 [Collimonas arenae]
MKTINAELHALPFEKVSIIEAKSVLDGVDAMPKSEVKRWEFFRRQEDRRDQDLRELTYQWFAKLPATEKPWELARYFPRITNDLAERWEKPAACMRFLEQLLLDNRGGRQGFPVNVAREIMALQRYFNQVVLAAASPLEGLAHH